MKLKLLYWWILPLLSICSFGATSRDSRLARAIENKDAEAIRALLDQHADVNGLGPDGSTAIMWAAHWDDLKTADRLIRAGANVNVANSYGATPMWLACYNGSAAMVGKLLDAGATPDADHLPAGETALLRCAATGNVNAVKSLLDHGANINATEKAGQTPLMWAIEEGHPDVVRLLIERGANVNAHSKGGFTPLLFAARQGDVDSGRLLLEKGASLQVTTREGLNPLLLAINSGREPITPQDERAEVLAALACVDAAVIFDEETPHDLIAALEPDVLVKGADWAEDAIVGRDIVEARGGRVVRMTIEPGYSTTRIVERIRRTH